MEELEAREACSCMGLTQTASWRRAGAIARGHAALQPAGPTACRLAGLLPLLAFCAGVVAVAILLNNAMRGVRTSRLC